MDEKKEIHSAESIAESVTEFIGSTAKTVINAAGELTADSVVPLVNEGLKGFSSDEETKKNMDHAAETAGSVLHTVTNVMSNVVEAGTKVVSGTIIPATVEMTETIMDAVKKDGEK